MIPISLRLVKKFQEKFELGFEIGLPLNDTQFSKTTISNTFFI